MTITSKRDANRVLRMHGMPALRKGTKARRRRTRVSGRKRGAGFFGDAFKGLKRAASSSMNVLGKLGLKPSDVLAATGLGGAYNKTAVGALRKFGYGRRPRTSRRRVIR